MNQVFSLECTMCKDNNRLEVHYGLQEYTGVQTGRCYLSEEKIQEIRTAKYEDVQDILSGVPVVWNK
jgi:alpha-glucuronidase